MPDDNDDQHIVLKFQPRPKSRDKSRPGREHPARLHPDPEDMLTSGAALLALVLAVAMVSGWVPVGEYTIGIVAGLIALAVAAKLIKARRSDANLPRQRR
jgi:hypothetical protein